MAGNALGIEDEPAKQPQAQKPAAVTVKADAEAPAKANPEPAKPKTEPVKTETSSEAATVWEAVGGIIPVPRLLIHLDRF